MFSNIHVYGCSHATLFNLLAHWPEPSFIQKEEGSWPNLLVDKHNLALKIYNNAGPGSDVWIVYCTIMKDIQEKKIKEQDLVIVQWPTILRRSIYYKNLVEDFYKYSWSHKPDWIMMPHCGANYSPVSEINSAYKTFYSLIFNEVENYTHMIGYTGLIENYCKNNNIFCMFTGCNTIAEFKEIENKHYKETKNFTLTNLNSFYSINGETPYNYIANNFDKEKIFFKMKDGTIDKHLNEYANDILSDKIAELIIQRFKK